MLDFFCFLDGFLGRRDAELARWSGRLTLWRSKVHAFYLLVGIVEGLHHISSFFFVNHGIPPCRRQFQHPSNPPPQVYKLILLSCAAAISIWDMSSQLVQPGSLMSRIDYNLNQDLSWIWPESSIIGKCSTVLLSCMLESHVDSLVNCSSSSTPCPLNPIGQYEDSHLFVPPKGWAAVRHLTLLCVYKQTCTLT